MSFLIITSNFAWNSSKFACMCDKACVIGEYLKDCECMKSLTDDLVFNETPDTPEDTPEGVPINPISEITYWLIAVSLLATECLLLLVAIVVKYYIKCGLIRPCLLTY